MKEVTPEQFCKWLSDIDVESERKEAYADGFAAGVKAMREAAMKVACPYCRDGVPYQSTIAGPGHVDRTEAAKTGMARAYRCEARAIRSLPDPPAEAE